jgi:hypothetical protein
MKARNMEGREITIRNVRYPVMYDYGIVDDHHLVAVDFFGVEIPYAIKKTSAWSFVKARDEEKWDSERRSIKMRKKAT